MPEERERGWFPSRKPAARNVPARQRIMDRHFRGLGKRREMNVSTTDPIHMDWNRKTTAREAERVSNER